MKVPHKNVEFELGDRPAGAHPPGFFNRASEPRLMPEPTTTGIRLTIGDPEGNSIIRPFPGGRVVIGRDSSAGIQLDHRSISRRHCEILEDSHGELLVRDLGSTNGTILNGVQVTEAALHPGDVLQLGNLRIMVEREGAEVAAPPSPEPAPSVEIVKFHPGPGQADLAPAEFEEAEQTAFTHQPVDFRNRFRRLHNAYTNLIAVSNLSARLTRVRSGREFYDLVIESLRTAFPKADNVAILSRQYDPSEARDDRETTHESGVALEVAAQEFYVAPEGSSAAPSRAAIQAMLASGRALYAVDAQKDPRLQKSDSVHIRGLRAVMCVPMFVEDRLVGALYVESVRNALCFDAFDLELLNLFANHVATAQENRRLYEALDQAYEKLHAEAQQARRDRIALNLAVRQSEMKFRALFEQTTLGTALVDSATGAIEEANEGLARLIGISRRDLPGRQFRDLFPSPENLAISDWIRFVLQRGEGNAETRIQHANGQILTVYHTCRPLQLGNKDLVLSNFLNITARKLAEQEIHTQLRRITTLQEVNQALMSTLDLNRLYRLVYEKVRGVIPTDAFLISLISPDGESIRPVFSVDLVDGQPQIFHDRDWKPTSTPFYSNLLEKLQPVLELRKPDATSQPYSPFGVESRRSASLLYVPMIAGDNVVGMMTAQTYTYNAYDESHLDLLLSIATLAALALQNGRLYESIRRQREDLQQLSNQILRAQENERGRISRELHDGIGQILTGLKLNLETVAHTLGGGDTPECEQLSDAIVLAGRAIEDLRTISHDLRPSMLDDLGLVPTLGWLCAEAAKRHDIDIKCNIDIGELRIAPDTESSIYRIVQEGLGNIVKHAQATQATVTLSRLDDGLQLTIVDNGRGFDANELPTWQAQRQCSGILNMKERAGILGGQFTLTSAPGEGTRLTFTIPYPGRSRK